MKEIRETFVAIKERVSMVIEKTEDEKHLRKWEELLTMAQQIGRTLNGRKERRIVIMYKEVIL